MKKSKVQQEEHPIKKTERKRATNKDDSYKKRTDLPKGVNRKEEEEEKRSSANKTSKDFLNDSPSGDATSYDPIITDPKDPKAL